MEFLGNLIHAFVEEGALWLWIILAVQLATVAIMIERVVYLYSKNKIGSKKDLVKYENAIKTGRLDEVKRDAEIGGSPIDQVVLAGTVAAMNWGGKDEIRGKMDEVLLEVNSKFENRTGFLAMLANVATLVGLLGTVTGMIRSFAAVSSASPVEKAALLSAGISEAMNATAYGLIAAIPALVMYAVLSNRGTKLAEDINHSALKVFNWLSYAYEPADRAIDLNVSKKKQTASQVQL